MFRVFSISKLTINDVRLILFCGKLELNGEVTLSSSRGIRFDGIEKVQTLSVTGFTQKDPAVFNFAGLKQVDKLTVNLGVCNGECRCLVFP